MGLLTDDLETRGLLADVLRARREVRQARRVGSSQSADVERAQTALASALEAYISKLDSSGTPVPYLVRDELRLYRGLCGRD